MRVVWEAARPQRLLHRPINVSTGRRDLERCLAEPRTDNRHFETLKSPGQHWVWRDSLTTLTCAIQLLQPRPVNRLNHPRCLLEPAAESSRVGSMVIERQQSLGPIMLGQLSASAGRCCSD
jgi:hypothetical protein